MLHAAASVKKTHQAYIWDSALKAPFWSMYVMMLFLLPKLGASQLQITIFIALRPVVSLFSIYWSAFVFNRPDRLRSNILVASLLGHLPFFFFPFIQHPWFLVFSSALYILLERGIIPAWMEILKINLPDEKRERTFSTGTTISFVSGIVLPILFGKWMDLSNSAWFFLFPITALFSIGGMYFQWRIPIKPSQIPPKKPIKIKESLLKPWKNSWELCKTRPDFVSYLLGFMLGGGGLMVIHPALPFFYNHTLQMSYTEIAIAVATCKGIGFALTSRIWARWMSRVSIYRFSALVTTLAALFPLAILLSKTHLFWIYMAYLIYGIMQAGSKLSWHLSGPIFSKEEDSSAYSCVNVLTVGLRGLFVPFIGSLLGASTALLIGGSLCSLATIQLTLAHARYRKSFDKNHFSF